MATHTVCFKNMESTTVSVQQTAFPDLGRLYNITVVFSAVAPELHWSVVQMSGVTTAKSHRRNYIDEL